MRTSRSVTSPSAVAQQGLVRIRGPAAERAPGGSLATIALGRVCPGCPPPPCGTTILAQVFGQHAAWDITRAVLHGHASRSATAPLSTTGSRLAGCCPLPWRRAVPVILASALRAVLGRLAPASVWSAGTSRGRGRRVRRAPRACRRCCATRRAAGPPARCWRGSGDRPPDVNIWPASYR